MHILLTGGGTAGHVIPNIAIAAAIKEFDPAVRISYMGSRHGIEKKLCKEAKIPFHAIQTGKWRRYFDLKNVVDLFRIPVGVIQAFFKLLRLRPKVVFSKGGYVGLPVVWAAWLLRIPVIIHESDAAVGLATRLTARCASRIFVAYPETEDALFKYQKKLKLTGNPIRLDLLDGSMATAKKITGFTGQKPILLIMGGSSGSQTLNHRILREKEALMEHYDLIHLTGEGKGGSEKEKHYFSQSYAEEELKDFYALASLALSRAGASALAELKALQIPSLLFPLGHDASRGDQWANAEALSAQDSLFHIGKEEKSLLKQLRDLPDRPNRHEENGATQKIALTLISDLRQ